jgi:uncharacterized membrane protein (DUF4010 family)
VAANGPCRGGGLAYALYLYLAARARTITRRWCSTTRLSCRRRSQFALIFVVVLVISRAGQYYFGDTGVYISSLIAGLADIDAVALSLAELSQNSGGPELTTAARGVLIAALANTVTKGGIVFATGTPALRRVLLPGFVLILATGAAAGLLLI